MLIVIKKLFDHKTKKCENLFHGINDKYCIEMFGCSLGMFQIFEWICNIVDLTKTSEYCFFSQIYVNRHL